MLFSVVGVIAYVYFLYKSKQLNFSCDEVKNEIEELGVQAQKSVKKIEVKTARVVKNLNERQAQLLDFLKEKQDWVRMTDLAEIFKNVTDRTLRRDLQKLFEERVILRKGNTKNRSYKHS